MQGEESARTAVSDFFTKKKCRLQRGLLETLLRRAPALLPAALPGGLEAAAAGRNEFVRAEAWLLLAAVVKVSHREGQLGQGSRRRGG